MRSFPNHLLLTRLRESRIRNAGPSFLMFTVAGKSKSVEVRRTFARIKSSPSGTRRWWVSSLASDSRLTSQPKTCNLADKSSCVQPLRSRNSRTRVPIKFNGNETFLMVATVAVLSGENVRFRSQIRACQKISVAAKSLLTLNSEYGNQRQSKRSGRFNGYGRKFRNAGVKRCTLVTCQQP